MLQNSDSLNCVGEKGVRMFDIFHRLEEYFVVCGVCFFFLKGVVNNGGENELSGVVKFLL